MQFGKWPGPERVVPVYVAQPGRFVVSIDHEGKLRRGSFDDRDAAVKHADKMARVTGRAYYVCDRGEEVTGGE